MQGGSLAQADVPEPQDVQTAQKAQVDPATRTSDALAASPHLAKDPVAAKAILSQPYADGPTTGGTANFLAAYAKAHAGVTQAAASQNRHSGNWFGNLWHGVAHIWDGVRHSVAATPRFLMNEGNALPHQAEALPGALRDLGNSIGHQVWHDATVGLPHYVEDSIQQNAANTQKFGVVGGFERNAAPTLDSTKALGVAVGHGLRRMGETFTELGSLGQVNSNFQADGNIGHNYADAVQTAANAANATVNPFTVYRNMAHVAAFTESLARRKGVGYALETMLPYLAVAMTTHTALVGAGVDQSAAGEILSLEKEVQAEGGTLTPEEAALGQEAQRVVPVANEEPGVAPHMVVQDNPPPSEEPAPPPQEPTFAPERSPLFRGVSRIVGTVTKPLAPFMNVAHALAAPTSDLRLNIMYALAHGGLSEDPEFSHLWQITANGQPVDANGVPLRGGVGAPLAAWMGLPQGAWANIFGGAVNLYSNYLGADPLGAIGKVIGQTRNFNSVGGIVGRMFGGMGVRTPEDVYRIGEQYVRGRRFFDWIANHSAGEINQTFKGLFLGEDGKKALQLLGDATTREQVMKHFADFARGEGYILNQIPGMTFYQVAKASFKYGDRPFTVGQSLAGTADEIQAQSRAIEDQTGIKVWPPDSANFAVGSGPVAAQMRTRTVVADIFAKLFTQRESYFNEATSKMENAVMDIGSTGLSAAIGDQLTALGEDIGTTVSAMDGILRASPEEMNNVILNVYHDTVLKLTFANAKYSTFDQVKAFISKDIKEQLQKMMGVDGPGEKGQMVNGPLGRAMSSVGEKNAAIGETHLGQLRFPRTRDLKGYAKFVGEQVEQFSRSTDGMLGVDEHLSADALDAKARFANSTLEGLGERLGGGVTGGTDALSQGYDAKMAELRDSVSRALAAVPEGDTIGHNRAFAQTYDMVRHNLDATRRIVNLVDEWNFNAKLLTNNPFEKQLQLEELNAKLPPGVFTTVESATPAATERLRGELSALETANAEMVARLQRDSIDLNELKSRIGMRDAKLTPEQIDTLAAKVERLRDHNPRYRNSWQAFIDGVNYYQSKVFVPLALYSGGWAIRVGNSEMLLNAFREGGMKMFQDKLLASYVKHETGRAVFTSRMEGLLARRVNKNLFAGSFGDMVKRTDLSLPEKLVSGTMRTAGGLILAMREAAGGALHGLEENLIKWTPRTERMFDRVVGMVEEYAPGGLPMGVHSSGGILADDAMQHTLLYGEDETGKAVLSTVHKNRTFASTNPGDSSYYRGMRGSLTRIHDDAVLLPAMRELHRQLPSLPETIDTAQRDQLLADMTQVTLKHIESLSAKDLARYERHTDRSLMALPDEEAIRSMPPETQLRVAQMTGEERTTFLNHYDWARVVASHDLHTVMGPAGADQFVIHRDLVNQAATGAVKPMSEIRKFIDALPRGTEPTDIVAETTRHEGAASWTNRLASAMNIPQEITNAGFHAVLGPMVNSYVRDPVYASIYDDEMEKLQSMVDQNLISAESQKLRAHQNSVVKMSRFVHNPQDRTLFESNMRAFAPFYFAQNQAWRRALRVASTDPGAFEKYLRASLAVTDFVAVKGQNGAVPVYIPGTQFMGAIGGLGSGLAPSQLGSLGFSLAASVGSVSSVIPTGSEAGLGVLENIVRPSWGPLVTTTLKESEHYLGLEHVPWAHSLITHILGPISSNASVMSEVLPSTFFRNMLNATEGILNIPNSSYASAQIYVLNNAVDNLSTRYFDEGLASLTKAGVPVVAARKIARSLADKQVADFLNIQTNAKGVQEFMDQVHLSASFMYLVKSVLGMGSPLALSLQQTFSKNTEFQKLLSAKKPDGTPRYSFEEAATKFADEFPNHIYDLVAHSKPIGSDYPETQAALNLIDNFPYVVSRYGTAAAYVLPRDGTYSPQAYQTELAMRMRSRYKNFSGGASGLGDYMDAILIANGNDYYYNWLKPLFPDTPGSAGYDNYKALTAKAKQYGLFDNPTWYGNFSSGGGRWASEAKAVTQMAQMLTDPNVPDSVYGGESNKMLYAALMNAYQATAAQYLGATSSRQRYQVEQDWYQRMTNMAANTEAMPPALSYFITSVLRNLPTAKE